MSLRMLINSYPGADIAEVVGWMTVQIDDHPHKYRDENGDIDVNRLCEIAATLFTEEDDVLKDCANHVIYGNF